MIRTALMTALRGLTPAFAQAAPCAKRADLLEHLSSRFGEVPVAGGLMPDGNVVEVVVSDNGSWTIVVTEPTGQTCGLVSGDAWSKSSAWRKRPKDIASR